MEASITIPRLAAALASLLPFVGPAYAADDAAYCRALAAKYRQFYVVDGGHYRDAGPIDGNIAAEQCLAGNTAIGPGRNCRDAKLPAAGARLVVAERWRAKA